MHGFAAVVYWGRTYATQTCKVLMREAPCLMRPGVAAHIIVWVVEAAFNAFGGRRRIAQDRVAGCSIADELNCVESGVVGGANVLKYEMSHGLVVSISPARGVAPKLVTEIIFAVRSTARLVAYGESSPR